MELTTKDILLKMVENSLKSQEDKISDELFKNVSAQDSIEQITTKAIRNCLALSISLSVQTVMDILIDSDVVNLDERKLAKIRLKLLSSEITETDHQPN